MLFAIPIREVSEWLKELAWKASVRVTVPWVRIPSSLQTSLTINDLTKSGTKSGTNVPDFLF